MEATILSEVEAGDTAEFARQGLEDTCEYVGHENDTEKFVLELSACSDIGGVITGVLESQFVHDTTRTYHVGD